MEFLALLGVNVAVIISMVAVLQFIKKPIRKKLLTTAKKATLDKIWIGVNFFFGLVAALVVELVGGFASFNLWLFIQHAFSYASGAAFVYMMRKTFLPPALQDDDEEKKPEEKIEVKESTDVGKD